MAFLQQVVGRALCTHLNQRLQRSLLEFPSARLCVHQCVPDMVEQNFTSVFSVFQHRVGTDPAVIIRCPSTEKLELAKNPSGGQDDG